MKLLSTGKVLIKGSAEGTALFSSQSLSFSRLDPRSGAITDRRVDLFGETIGERVLIFSSHRGSTTSPAVFLEVCRQGLGPRAMVVAKSDPMLLFSALLAKKFYGITIPLIEGVDLARFQGLRPEDHLKIDGPKGRIFLIS
jgi:predicted aconitase with swiveling domain